MDPSELGSGGKRLGPRRGSTRRRGADDEPPPLFEGQVVRTPSGGGSGSDEEEAEEAQAAEEVAAPASGGAGDASGVAGEGLDAQALGLPTDGDSIVRYMANRYRGVGEKTAEALVERFGEGVFEALRSDPDAVREVITPRRAEQVLEAWEADYERRVSRRSRG
jgi:hypothetical protein